jgi:hypothetical protein
MGAAGFRLGNIGAEFVLALCFLTSALMIAVIAYPNLVARVRNDPRRCARGRFTYWGILIGYTIGWMAAVPKFFGAGLPLSLYMVLGLIVGAALGNFVGRIVAQLLNLKAEEVGV